MVHVYVQCNRLFSNLKGIMNSLMYFPFHQQVEISNIDQCCRPFSACVTVDLGGGFKATGTTCSGGAVLLSLQGQDFPAPATLSGTTVVFSAADSAQLLSAVSGELRGLNSRRFIYLLLDEELCKKIQKNVQT